jgi:hypothetical protein
MEAMNPFANGMTRKRALGVLVLPALTAAIAAGTGGIARADNRVDLKYQSTPKGDQMCSACTLFVPGKTPASDGTCKVITGTISPNGWCTAFAKRSP